MRILDRYILKSVIKIFISCIFVFLFMYIIIDILSHLEDILKQQANYELLIQYYLYYIPIMFVQMAPFACLIATLYTFGKLNHDNEIIAMRASGLSIFYITKTVILFGLMVSLFIFWINDRFVPSSMILTQKLKSQMESSSKKIMDKKDEVIANLSMYGLKNRLFFISKFYPGKNLMQGINIMEHDEKQNLTKKIVANSGVFDGRIWKFNQCITYNFDHNGQILQEPLYQEEEIMTIPETPKDFLSQRQRPEYMTINQLDDYIWRLSRSGASAVIRNFKIDLYQRYAIPLTSLVIILLGIPFSLMMRKRATGLSSIGVSILVGFLYYILDAVCIALGKGGLLPPILSASLSHMIAIAVSIYLINNLP